MSILQCEICNKEIKRSPSQIRKHNFCSRQCKYEWNKTLVGYWKGKKIPQEFRDKMSANHADVSGKNNPRWKGGKRIDKTGYVLILKSDHPYADYHGYVREHRLVMEAHLGRILKPKEVVHHMNHIKTDNRIENLMLLKDCSEHMKLHGKERKDAKNNTST